MTSQELAHTSLFRRAACILALCMPLAAQVASGDRLWWDGTKDAAEGPPGKLLSDNAGYWGECVLTGVEYQYETEPDSPKDVWRDEPEKFGRRLLDGLPHGNWWIPVGLSRKPIVVTFDFKRPCVFAELDLATRNRQVSIKLETRADAEAAWQLATERTRDEAADSMLQRVELGAKPAGRFLRLSVQADPKGTTYLEEVWVWGDAEVSEELPELYQPIKETPVITGTAFASVPGIPKTAFSDHEFWDWQKALGDNAQQPAVWSRRDTWNRLTHAPILPAPDDIVREVQMTMARNETECVALALTNTSMDEPFSTEVSLGTFRRADGQAADAQNLTGNMRVGGAIYSRHYGVNIGPLFETDNMLGRSLMRRYLTNAEGIADFPRLTLSRGGSAVLWLSIMADHASPGVYEANLVCEGAKTVRVHVEVLDVLLPRPFVWLHTWSGTTSMLPFTYGDRLEREVAYKRSMGVTVWRGFPTPNTGAALAREKGKAIFHYSYGIPRKLVDMGYGGRIKPDEITAVQRESIRKHVEGVVAQAKELGLSYDDWYVELWDEPGRKNSLLYGAFARIIHETDPKVRVYCNPCFWEGKGVVGDDEVVPVLGPWYKEVSVSVPLYLLLRDHPKSYDLFDAQRPIRAWYTVATQSAKSERAAQLQSYRKMGWDTFKRGWNGWGFYSYYAPRGSPWNDFDANLYTKEDRPDYLMVYPGPRGMVPTRQSEAVREGWEDYCLLTLLKERRRDAELADMLKAYEAGEPMEELRLRALSALAAP